MWVRRPQSRALLVTFSDDICGFDMANNGLGHFIVCESDFHQPTISSLFELHAWILRYLLSSLVLYSVPVPRVFLWLHCTTT